MKQHKSIIEYKKTCTYNIYWVLQIHILFSFSGSYRFFMIHAITSIENLMNIIKDKKNRVSFCFHINHITKIYVYF